jgi:hypothetical protein
MDALQLNIFDHPSGWGPIDDVSEEFKAIPFIPFNKASAAGKVFDWEQSQQFQQRGARFDVFALPRSFLRFMFCVFSHFQAAFSNSVFLLHSLTSTMRMRCAIFHSALEAFALFLILCVCSDFVSTG